MRTIRKLIAGASGAAVIAGGTLLTGALSAEPAQAQPHHIMNEQLGHGHKVVPGQVVDGDPWPSTWLGSFVVRGEQVWCVQFGFESPDHDEQYQPGGDLTDKWGGPLPDGTAAKVSYLLQQHGTTKSDDQAAAVAHLLHSWTAAPRSEADLDPTLPAEEIAYDVEYHKSWLADHEPQVLELAERFRADAERNHGPWQATLSAPSEQQVIGQPATWTLQVTGAEERGIGGVPVALRVSDATVRGLSEDGKVTTPADGSALRLEVTPTGPNPKISGELVAPAAQPNLRQSSADPHGKQRVVSSGGEEKLAVQADTAAVAPTGALRVSKIDEVSKAGIAGVALRVSAPNGAAALRTDGTPLVGEDGQPLVVTTAQDGSVTVPDLRAPQEVRVTEVAPAKGYEQSFDALNPPAVNGTVRIGQTADVVLSNRADVAEVPLHIPAGDPRGDVTEVVAPTTRDPLSAGLIGFGALAVLGAAAGGTVAHRRTLTGDREL